MNRVLKTLIGVVVVLLIVSPPLQARPHEDRSWRGPAEKVVKFLQTLHGAVRSFGDGLTDPRP